MKYKRVRSADSIGWFDIESYKALQDITLPELVGQIKLRISFLNDHLFDDTGADNYFLDSIESGKVVLLEPALGSFHEVNVLKKSKTTQLDHGASIHLDNGNGIYLLTNFKLYHTYKKAKKKGLFDYFIYGEGTVGIGAAVSACLAGSQDTSIIADIHLNNKTDEELIAELRELLPQWRKAKGIPERTTYKGRLGERIFLKIINYNVVPILDLMIWEKIRQVKFSMKVWRDLVFPNSIESGKGEEHLKKSIFPFVKEVVCQGFVEDLTLLIKTNSVLRTRMVRDHFSISEV